MFTYFFSFLSLSLKRYGLVTLHKLQQTFINSHIHSHSCWPQSLFNICNKKKREKKPYIPWLRWNICKEPFDLDLWYFSCVATDGVYFVSLLPFDGDTVFFSSSIFDFRSKVYVHFLSISSSLWLDSSFSLVLWFALQTNVDGLWCDGTNYEKRFCLGIFVTLDRNCSHQHFHTTHYHLCGTVKHT